MLQVNIYPAAEYARMRADKNAFHAPIDGVGDEAFTGPAGAPGARGLAGHVWINGLFR